MTSVFETLFDTYGDSLMREHLFYDHAVLQAAVDKLHLEPSASTAVDDLLTDWYLRWSTAAFAIGLHLGLSLGNQVPGHQHTP